MDKLKTRQDLLEEGLYKTKHSPIKDNTRNLKELEALKGENIRLFDRLSSKKSEVRDGLELKLHRLKVHQHQMGWGTHWEFPGIIAGTQRGE